MHTEIRPLLRLGKWTEADALNAQIVCLDDKGVYARARSEEEERRRHEAETCARKQRLTAEVRALLAAQFLSADEEIQRDPDFGLLSPEEYSALKVGFIRKWAKQELGLDLDDQQAGAVAAVRGDVEVVARAGSGKTRTLVARALFLQLHCGVSPQALLLLAFNKAAADEMSERLKRALDERTPPHVMTFHALAHALVHPEEDLLYDNSSSGELGLSREIQQVVDEHLQSARYRPLIRDLMLAHFQKDWEQIVKGGFHLPAEDLVKWRRALPRETLKGDYVKSLGERVIANALFEHDIEYKYERNFRWGGVNYRPDFTILLPDGCGVVIEYFGLKGDSDYDGMCQEKREFWATRSGWRLIEFCPADVAANGVEGFSHLLLERLEEVGVTGKRLSDQEMWRRIERRGIDRFTGAMRTFVNRCRKRDYSASDLGRLVAQHEPITEAEGGFLEVAQSVYSGYLQRLEENQQEDFDGLMRRAIAFLKEGHSSFVRRKGREQGDIRNLRFVLVDEFQDFSELFHGLLQGIRALNSTAQFFCVGDDWQAINGFAGSDLRFFAEFDTQFRDTSRAFVGTNYRSPVGVVELGNALMAGRGIPAVPYRPDKGWVKAGCLSDFFPSVVEEARHAGDEATPAVLRLARHLLDRNCDVVMLARRHAVPWYVNYGPDAPEGPDELERFAEHIRSFLPPSDWGRVTASTVHQYKGREKAAVILLDADERCFPLIHPTWMFLRVFGDTVEQLEAEERRLFYVALTRSQQALAILSDDAKRRSPYMVETRTRLALDAIAWPELSEVATIGGSWLVVTVANAFAVRELLKDSGYRWDNERKLWYRSVMGEGFDFEDLCRQAWAQSGVSIAVHSEDGRLLHAR
jgi:DNA helicase-4